MGPRAVVILSVWTAVIAGCLTLAESPGDGVSLAAALIWQAEFASISIEIDYQPGQEPSAAAIVAMREILQGALKKPVEVLPLSALPRHSPENGVWTIDAIEEYANETFSLGSTGRYGRNGSAFIHVLYLDGEFRQRDGSSVSA